VTLTKEPIPPRMRFMVLARDGFACRYCGYRPPEVRLEVDHVVPEALGGPTEPENLIAACDRCNVGKGPVPLSAFAAEDVQVATVAGPFDLALVLTVDAELSGILAYYLARFDREWLQWRTDGGDGDQLPRPQNWALTIARFLLLGVPFGLLCDLVDQAMRASPDPWAFLHGSAWAWVARQPLRSLPASGQEAALVLAWLGPMVVTEPRLALPPPPHHPAPSANDAPRTPAPEPG
jgi:hypothetical protein